MLVFGRGRGREEGEGEGFEDLLGRGSFRRGSFLVDALFQKTVPDHAAPCDRSFPRRSNSMFPWGQFIGLRLEFLFLMA